MRRVMLLALLALALPLAASASSVVFSTGAFEKGTVTTDVSGGFSSGSWMVQVFGSMDTITVSATSLSPGCENGLLSGFCSFGGHITVSNPAGQLIFQDPLDNGNIRKGALTGGESTAIITGDLLETPGPPP